MTVASEISRNDYVGLGTTATYSYTFRIFAATDLLVTKADTAGVETNLTYPTDYSVSGVGSFAGGNIVLTAGNLPADYGLTLRFRTGLLQGTDIRNQSGFFPEVIEDALDRLTKMDQQQQDELARSLRLPETEAGSVAARTLPTVTERASKFLAFNASGNPIPATALSSSVPATPFMETVLDDTTANAALTTLTATRSEAGAVAVTVLNKLNEVLSAKDFGAVGDGVADDAAALQAGINAASTAGRVLHIPAGVYLVGVGLTVTSNRMRIFGDGERITILKRKTGAVIASVLHCGVAANTIQTTYLHISGLLLDGNAGCTDAVLKAYNVGSSWFRNLEIIGGAADGFKTDSSTTTTDTNQFRNYYDNIYSNNNAVNGIFMRGEKFSVMGQLVATYNGGVGVWLRAYKDDGGAGNSGTSCQVDAIFAHNNTGDGVVLDNLFLYSIGSINTSGNSGYGVSFRCTETGATTPNLNAGLTIGTISARNDALGGLVSLTSTNGSIRSSHIGSLHVQGFSSLLDKAGVQLHGAGPGLEIGSCTITGFHSTGLYVQSGTPGGVAQESLLINFGTLVVTGNGDAAAVSNHGIQLGNSATCRIGTLISANNQTTGTNHEVWANGTVSLLIGTADLSPAAAANSFNGDAPGVTFGVLKRGGITPILSLPDGVTAPATDMVGQAQIYIDAADGDLKIRFADGIVKVIVIDT